MTRRERLEAKIEKRREWAASREQKASALYHRRDPYNGDIAFWTQPGHIPERARIIKAIDKSFEHQNMANHHEAKANALERQIDRTIFSDDENAPEALAARVAELEAKRERMKLVNKLYKKGDAAALAAVGVDLEALRAKLAAAGLYWGSAPHLPYEFSNLGGNISRLRDRIKDVETRRARTEKAEAAPGGVVIEGDTYVRVTFAEKPAREILNALRAAGFRWGGGSWVGERAKLPEGVTSC